MLWRQGVLEFLLDSNQLEIHKKIKKSKSRKFVVNMARRTGKSYLLCVMALEAALKSPNQSIKYAAPTQRQVRRVIRPLFTQILETCPEDIRPQYHAQEGAYEFHNGSVITIAGIDAGQADALRGTDATLCICDEAGFTPARHLKDIVQSVMMPMLMLTGGKVIIASTPPKTPRHYFEDLYNECKSLRATIHRTVYDNPRLTVETINEFKKECGGEQSTEWKREYLAQFVVDETLMVFPEFNEDLQKQVIREWDRPPYFDAYVSMDPGIRDQTAILFGYWDFKQATLVIEDEVILQGIGQIRSDIIAEKLRGKEKTYWGDKLPLVRVCDGEMIMLNDLSFQHGIRFAQAEKDNKEAAVNFLRTELKAVKIAINPRCQNLIDQLACCVWAPNMDKFDRIPGLGHFDAVDALIYMLRAIRRNHNPYPATVYSHDSHFVPKPTPTFSMNTFAVKALFPTKKFGE